MITPAMNGQRGMLVSGESRIEGTISEVEDDSWGSWFTFITLRGETLRLVKGNWELPDPLPSLIPDKAGTFVVLGSDDEPVATFRLGSRTDRYPTWVPKGDSPGAVTRMSLEQKLAALDGTIVEVEFV